MLDSINFIDLIVKILALFIAIVGHEIMHGFIALKYGDDTAKLAGRLSINPIKHIDLLGSIILPLLLFFTQAPFLFGWAKPVPVDIRKVIQNGGYGGAIFVSLAGIAYNICLALFAAGILRVFDFSADSAFSVIIAYFLAFCVIYNVVLACFNLLPIPPLDGSQALGYLSLKFGSDKIPIFFNKIERFGLIIIMMILFFGVKYISEPMMKVIKLLLG